MYAEIAIAAIGCLRKGPLASPPCAVVAVTGGTRTEQNTITGWVAVAAFLFCKQSFSLCGGLGASFDKEKTDDNDGW